MCGGVENTCVGSHHRRVTTVVVAIIGQAERDGREATETDKKNREQAGGMKRMRSKRKQEESKSDVHQEVTLL